MVTDSSRRALNVSGRRRRVTRRPVLVPAPRGWAGRELVRALRIRVTDAGDLVVERAGATEVRAGPGEVTQVVLARDPAEAGLPPARFGAGLAGGDDHGLLVVLAGDRPVLAIRLAEWVPAPAALDSRTVRAVSGADALAAALGRAVEPADAGALLPRARDVADALVSPLPRTPRAATAAVAAGVGAVLVWLAASVAVRYAEQPPHAAFSALGALGVVLLTAPWLLLRRRASRPLPPPPGTPIAPAPAGPVPAGFRRCRAYVSPDWVVLVDSAGREAWLPGPAAGGVTAAAVTTAAVVFDDADGNGLAALPRAAWAGAPGAEERLRAALERAGLDIRDEPSNRAPGTWLTDPTPLVPLDDRAFGALREARGVPGTAGSVGAGAAALLTWSGIVDGRPWVAAVAGTAGLATLATVLAEAWRARADRRTT